MAQIVTLAPRQARARCQSCIQKNARAAIHATTIRKRTSQEYQGAPVDFSSERKLILVLMIIIPTNR
jgi:hypothetical protein